MLAAGLPLAGLVSAIMTVIFRGLGFRVWGLGFRVWGLGFRVWDVPPLLTVLKRDYSTPPTPVL